MHARWMLTIIAAVISAATAPGAAAQSADRALRAVETVWGFDGRVQPGQFNPLSLLLDNQTDEDIEGTLILRRTQGLLNDSKSRYETDIFISATARRWVQFYPYIADTRSPQWEISIREKKDGQLRSPVTVTRLTQPRAAVKSQNEQKEQPPQAIILDRAGRLTTQPSAVKHVPENIFPPYSTATAGLHTVFLDHVPDWELPRQESFLSWLKSGGRLHLLYNGRSEYPRFGGALLDLNQPEDQFRVGFGIVRRHPVQRAGVSDELVRRAIVIGTQKGVDESTETALQKQIAINQGLVSANVEPEAIDDTFFRGMRELTLPEHAWWLIFALAIAYIGLLFPGCYRLSQDRSRHYLTTYGAILGLATVFSLLFLVIGRRGYGETTTMQILALARAEDNSQWNVMQWNSLFVTAGDTYNAQAPDQQCLWAPPDGLDDSDVTCVAGNSGGIAMRIPPFSSQTFLCRRTVAAAPWNLKIIRSTLGSSGPVELQIQVGKGLPRGEKTKYLVLHGRNVYEMRLNKSQDSLSLLGQRQALAAFCESYFLKMNMNQPLWQNPSQETDERTQEEIFFDESLPMLVQRSLLDDFVYQPSVFELPGDRVRLFVFTELPQDFALNISTSARTNGRILFCRDLFLNNDTN